MSELLHRDAIFGARGTSSPPTSGFSGGTRVALSHGKYSDAALAGRIFTFGLSNTALVAANAIATGLTATAQPIIAVYNPTGSGKNFIINRLFLEVTTVDNSAVSPGGFMWVKSADNPAVSTGSVPINTLSLKAFGSAGKAYAVATALTGLTNNLAVLRSTGIAPFNAGGAATAVSLMQGNGIEEVDGSIICPPGGVVGVMNQLSTTTCAVSVGIEWEEVPLV